MANLLTDDITRILAQFAGRGFDTQVVAVKGPVQEGMNYSWQLISKPYDDVDVTVVTHKPQFARAILASVAVHGLGSVRAIQPDLEDVRAFFSAAELVPKS